MRDNDQKIIDLTDAETVDQVRIALAGLKRVEAPADFDFRVRARISNGKPAARPVSWMPAYARFAVPLVLMLLIGGYFGRNAVYSPDNIPQGVTAGASVQSVAYAPREETVAASSPDLLPEIEEAKPAEALRKIDVPSPAKRGASRRTMDVRPASGSIDLASGVSRQIYPKGAGPGNVSPLNPAMPEAGRQIAARDLLERIGVKASYSAAGWTVQSVSANYAADKSGVKAGDVITAVNGQSLSQRTMFGNTFTAKTLRVSRDGREAQIVLNP